MSKRAGGVQLRLAGTLLGALVLLVGCSSGGPDPAASSAAPPPSSSSPSSAASSPPSASSSAGEADWPTYHGDATRSGAVPGGPDPASPAVAWRRQLDGAVYASPLVVGGEVVAATEGGSLYGLDPATGAVRWRSHLADPLPGSALPCGNIDPIGITGTPAYDPATGQVFAVAVRAAARGVLQHVLFGVDPATGAVRTQQVADAPGSTPVTHLQRGALLVAGGRVYVPYGGNAGDCGQYLGRVVGLPTSGQGGAVDFAVPTTREGGIWAPPGPALLPGGDLLVTTGNGEAVDGRWDSSDSILHLSPDLRLLDGFAPTGWAQENSADADLGSSGPLVLPGARRVLAAGKGGEVYLADVDHLGGVGGQLARLGGCRAFGGGATTADPSAPGAAIAWLPCTDGVLQVRVGADDALSRGWQADGVPGSPVVVGSTVWALDGGGGLHALDAATGAERAAVDVGETSRFATPAVSGGTLFVPTLDGVVAVAVRR